MTKPLYMRGPPIRDICAVVALLGEERLFYWAHDPRPKSPKVLANMPLAVLEIAARHGNLRLAIKREARNAT